MAKCSQCLHWDACSMLFEIAIGRKPTANGNKAEEKCPHFKDKTINTNADRIRAMSDEELDEWIARTQIGAIKDAMNLLRLPYDEPDGLVEMGKTEALEWLKQPAEGD